MANTSGRMLELLSLLQTHRFWPGMRLADRLGVSERTLRRDIDRLRELGYPVDATRGVSGGYQLRSGTAMPPLLLDDAEAVAIAVGLRTAATSALAGIDDTAVAALTKVVQVMPPRLRRRVDALHDFTVPGAAPDGPTVDALALTTLAQACRDAERLRFGYRRAERDSPGEGLPQSTGGERSEREAPDRIEQRLVEPNRLVSLGRRWYLVAWDLHRHDWRTFRVDRLTDPKPTGERFRQRDLPHDDAAEFVRSRLSALRQFDVEVEIQMPVEAARRRIGWYATVEPLDDETCLLSVSTDELHWPTLMLIALEADFTVRRPAELTDYLRSVGEFLLRSTSPPMSASPPASDRS